MPKRRWSRRLLVVSVLSCLVPQLAGAEVHSLDDAGELAVFLDGAVPALLESDEVPGMTVSVVRDGEVLFAKGYGLATVATREPVVAERTLFRVGSVSKIFLATAIMQLVEQGRLDLDTDLNTYLEGVEIPETFEQPITLRHVLTHTPGFEDSYRDIFVGPDHYRPLRDTLADYIPERVWPPGEMVAYSNHATALAGLVVEQVSGEPYADYLDHHILEPLGMTRSTAQQPVPDSLAPDLSTGARADDFFAYVPDSPAGSVSATASDMARFMIAHLQYGRLGDTRILQAETARRMQSRLFTLDPRVNGFAYQFFESDMGGLRVIGHAGGMVTHFTNMALLPEEGVGFFASVNGASRGPFVLTRQFLERYFPQVRPGPRVALEGSDTAERAAGWYSESRGGVHHFSRVGRFMSMRKAVAGENGRLQFMDETWVETEPLLFRQIDGPNWLVFREGEDGTIRDALRGLGGHSMLLREPFWRGLDFQRAVAAALFAVLLWPIFHRPLWRVRRWWSEVRGGGTLAGARWVAAGLRLSALAFLVCFAWGATVLARTTAMVFSPALWIAGSLPFAIALLSVGAAIACGRLWREGVGSRATRLGYTGLTLGGFALVGWAHAWNVLATRM